MEKVHYAAIDVGSNAVRLLIKCVNSEGMEEPLSKVLIMRVPIRLGEDSFTKGYIGEEKTDNMVRLMRAYYEMMQIYRVKDYRACATSAMRDASNAEAVIAQIREKTGIHIDIIDGDEEARLVSDNHIEQIISDGGNYIYLDVGGGSTELTIPAAEIFLEVADITGAKTIIAPIVGLADGIIEDLYIRHQSQPS
ncbi:conserved domain protein [Porphyromonas gingivalis W83]|uniref:Conserved domain protein n=1 Tax=Porphyromonas gingivalis (strain ATCC BAA-308 / W83) TaxID=242619 RepID=Q7MU29_PORGI|nr:hypothetical protein [Porphyromonas gingivalis]AAQ66744.1 conserved domain protein [Porphyromonas gingivalis W83]AUR46794.1 guanosine-5'-triphosphate,3'-diphosphate pyrophosphatase [Porphyromonas gingivalis]